MTKFILFILVFLLTAQTVNSQFHFLKRGRIVFERKINTYAIITDFVVESKIVQVTELNSYLQNYKSNNSQFWIDSFQLFFDSIQTFYEPIGAVSKFLHGVGTQTSHANKVFSNLSNKIAISEKYAHNEIFLIKDSVKKIKWKLTDEVLDIAGFECRRANAIIMDSIYIV